MIETLGILYTPKDLNQNLTTMKPEEQTRRTSQFRRRHSCRMVSASFLVTAVCSAGIILISPVLPSKVKRKGIPSRAFLSSMRLSMIAWGRFWTRRYWFLFPVLFVVSWGWMVWAAVMSESMVVNACGVQFGGSSEMREGELSLWLWKDMVSRWFCSCS